MKPEYESRLYENRSQADAALERLQEIGYGRDHISLILNERDLPADQNFESDTAASASGGTEIAEAVFGAGADGVRAAIGGAAGGTGAAIGAAAGGIFGAILMGAAGAAMIAATQGAAAPVVAGPLVAALAGLGAGAAGGSIIGGLMELGVEAQDWHAALLRGGVAIVVSLKSHDDRSAVGKALTGE